MPLLEMRSVSKIYPGVRALDDVSIAFEEGEIHCIVGENGAGKSTLIKILAGALPMDGGELLFDQQPALFRSPSAALRAGITVIYQDSQLLPELTVAENIFLGREPVRPPFGLINIAEMRRRTQSALTELHNSLDPDSRAGDLTPADRQVVEIARALTHRVRIVVLDEPTASLTGRETLVLFRILKTLRSQGVTVVFISHRLEEIFALGDRVTVLRDGHVVGTYPVAETSRDGLIRMIVGRDLAEEFPRAELTPSDEVLRVEALSGDRIRDISFVLHRGEILGFAGLVGAGRTDLAMTLFGAQPASSGMVYFRGKEFAPRSPQEAIRAGIGLLTEDRNRQGLFLDMTVRENISIASLRAFSTGPFVDMARERMVAANQVRSLRIKTTSPEAGVETLSGGNRQKVVVARWLVRDAQLLIFDEPTVGIDVGVKYEIYQTMQELARRGVGVLMISSDMEELLGVCTRIAVMREGTIAGIVNRDEATQESILRLAAPASG